MLRMSAGQWLYEMQPHTFSIESQLALDRLFRLFFDDGIKPAFLVYRLLNPLNFVAFKMGRLRGGPSRTGAKRSISRSIRD
jgi:hypothetical protein